jgi:ubiquinol-cytochrome c reductase iron-sulfur subunit
MDSSRRTALGLTCAAGAVGGAAVVIPFVSTFAPSEKAKAAGAPVEVDISAMNPGELKRVEWRGKPVWVVRRTKEMLDTLAKTDPQLADPKSARTAFPTPDYAKNATRSIKPEYLVVVGICSHLGCSPSDTALLSIWPAGYSRTSPHPTILKCPPTCISATHVC